MEHVSKIVSGLSAVIEISYFDWFKMPSHLFSEDVIFETWCSLKNTGWWKVCKSSNTKCDVEQNIKKLAVYICPSKWDSLLNLEIAQNN